MKWVKSSFSFSNGNCVEVALPFRKSSRSNSGGCVEAATCPHGVLVRDSKDPDGPRLSFAPADWRAFTAAINAA